MDYQKDVETAVQVVRNHEKIRKIEFTDEQIGAAVRQILYQQYCSRVGAAMEKADGSPEQIAWFAQDEYYKILLSDLRRVDSLIDHRKCEAGKWVTKTAT
jgi:hypothetical protein